MTPDGRGASRPVLVMLAAGMAKRYGGCKPLAPVGPHGEAVIDLTTSDALDAGFGHVVLVLGPHSGPAIEYHVERCWPRGVTVTAVEQTVPLGTAHAVLCARDVVGRRPFGVVNADDVYGVGPLRQLAGALAADGNDHVLVTFRLEDTVVSGDPVTRGTVETTPDGKLRSMVERRKVTRLADGTFAVGDGLDPAELAGTTPVSMNLWGFRPSIWHVFERAVRAEHPAVAPDGRVDPAEAGSDAEVLLPDVVGAMVRKGNKTEGGVEVLAAEGRCIGVTHADDLQVARLELAELVGRGERAEWPWESVR
ncbi:MAG TPA: sugar phosphate nucleotidyltransferase [Acidimicrobiales bacterium]|nr:sugar phosphate nucleotidyltransferase [Acidimicrobiales bacterium]